MSSRGFVDEEGSFKLECEAEVTLADCEACDKPDSVSSTVRER